MNPETTYWLFLLLLFAVAFFYSSVGHGGASGYLALMALFGMAPAVMKSSALLMNICVSLISFIHYYRGGHFKWKLFFPFAIASVPASFLGALVTVDVKINSKIPPYHYMRVHPYNEQFDLLISGGEDHPIANTSKTHVSEENRYKLLEDWTRKHFPMGEIIYRWSGQVLEPMVGIAFIGRNPLDHDNVYIVTGDSGNEMTHCSFAGLLISDLINGKKNKWEQLYSPSRFTVKKSAPVIPLLTDDLVDVLKKWFYAGSVELSAVKNGEARIVKLGSKKCGAYRDGTGKLFLVPAECTHLKCMVLWNNDEKSWDCPCHGSRFTYEGKVINGPANVDLPAYSDSENVSASVGKNSIAIEH